MLFSFKSTVCQRVEGGETILLRRRLNTRKQNFLKGRWTVEQFINNILICRMPIAITTGIYRNGRKKMQSRHLEQQTAQFVHRLRTTCAQIVRRVADYAQTVHNLCTDWMVCIGALAFIHCHWCTNMKDFKHHFMLLQNSDHLMVTTTIGKACQQSVGLCNYRKHYKLTGLPQHNYRINTTVLKTLQRTHRWGQTWPGCASLVHQSVLPSHSSQRRTAPPSLTWWRQPPSWKHFCAVLFTFFLARTAEFARNLQWENYTKQFVTCN